MWYVTNDEEDRGVGLWENAVAIIAYYYIAANR